MGIDCTASEIILAPSRAQYPSASRLDWPGCAEYPSGSVFGPHGYVRLVGTRQEGRFESVPGYRSQGLQVVRVRAGEYLPAIDFGGPVPADVEREVAVWSLLDRHRRVIGGVGAPRKAKTPVGVISGGQVGVEEKPAVRGELGHVCRAAPPDEHVTIRQHLHVALGCGEQPVGGGEYAYQGGGHVVFVELYRDSTGLIVHPG